MTDRVNYLTVTLDHGIRTDDAAPLIAAIKLLRGVTAVAINVSDPASYSAEARVKSDLRVKLWDVLS